MADYSGNDQLKKYAEDIARIYAAEKEKSRQLEEVKSELLKYAGDLNKTIAGLKTAHQELEQSYLDTIYRLAMTAEYKDECTGSHIIRISRYCAFLTEKLGLPTIATQSVLHASPMHDVGKIGIPDNILLKPGKLTDQEFEIMKTHTTIGAKILANSQAPIMKIAERIALSHHERWDGTGYPQGLAGEKIPLFARIVGLLDVFDALSTRRPYKAPYPIEVSCDMIKKEKEKHFDPELVDVFLKNINEILKIRKEVGGSEEVDFSNIIWSERDVG